MQEATKGTGLDTAHTDICTVLPRGRCFWRPTEHSRRLVASAFPSPRPTRVAAQERAPPPQGALWARGVSSFARAQASNVDRVVVICATEPPVQQQFVDRVLVVPRRRPNTASPSATRARRAGWVPRTLCRLGSACEWERKI